MTRTANERDILKIRSQPICEGDFHMKSNKKNQEIKVFNDNGKPKISIYANQIDITQSDCTKIDGWFKIKAEDLVAIYPMLDPEGIGWISDTHASYILPKDYAIKQFGDVIDAKNNLIDTLHDKDLNTSNIIKKLKSILSRIPNWVFKLFLKSYEYSYIKEFKNKY